MKQREDMKYLRKQKPYTSVLFLKSDIVFLQASALDSSLVEMEKLQFAMMFFSHSDMLFHSENPWRDFNLLEYQYPTTPLPPRPWSCCICPCTPECYFSATGSLPRQRPGDPSWRSYCYSCFSYSTTSSAFCSTCYTGQRSSGHCPCSTSALSPGC